MEGLIDKRIGEVSHRLALVRIDVISIDSGEWQNNVSSVSFEPLSSLNPFSDSRLEVVRR